MQVISPENIIYTTLGFINLGIDCLFSSREFPIVSFSKELSNFTSFSLVFSLKSINKFSSLFLKLTE